MVDYFKVANNGCGLDYTEGGGLNVETVATRLSRPWMIARSTRICLGRQRSGCIRYCATITRGFWPWILTKVIGKSQYKPSGVSVKNMPYLV